MKYLFLVILVVGAATFVLAMMKVRASPDAEGGGSSADYEALRTVLSPAERHFLGVLAPLLPPGVGVLVKVRLADVFTPKRGLDASRRQAATQRMRAQSIDFLLVRADDFSPLAGLALREDSARTERKAARDHFVENTFARNGLPFLTVKAQPDYDREELKRRLATVVPPQHPPA